MPFHLESLWDVTLMPHTGCAMDWDKTKIVRVGKISGPGLSRLWTTVHEILQQCRRPFALSNALADCLYHVSFSRYSPLSLEVVEKLNKYKSFLAPNFFGRDDPNVSTADC